MLQERLRVLYTELDKCEDADETRRAMQLQARTPQQQHTRESRAFRLGEDDPSPEMKYAHGHSSVTRPVENLAVIFTGPKRKKPRTQLTRKYS